MLDQGNREVGVTYRIRVAGTVGPATRAAFRDLRVQTGSGLTQLSGELDQIALHRVLERIESLATTSRSSTLARRPGCSSDLRWPDTVIR
jgi:hypothetical protein